MTLQRVSLHAYFFLGGGGGNRLKSNFCLIGLGLGYTITMSGYINAAVGPYLTLTISAGFPTIPPKKPGMILKRPFVQLLIDINQKHTCLTILKVSIYT